MKRYALLAMLAFAALLLVGCKGAYDNNADSYTDDGTDAPEPNTDDVYDYEGSPEEPQSPPSNTQNNDAQGSSDY